MKEPIYDIKRTWLSNLETGPMFKAAFPEFASLPEGEYIDFLGKKLASPLGISAGPILNSMWVKFAAKMGYDLITYKTIRSQSHPGFDLPNMVFVEPLDRERVLSVPTYETSFSLTNSFGMPSKDPTYLQEDIAKAKSYLNPHQCLIVSIVGTPHPDYSLFEDYVRAALLAKEAGAEIVEANFSCPNIKGREGSLYLDAEAVFELTSLLTKALKETPLILKVGVFPSHEILRNVLLACARAKARAIAGINTISRQVVDKEGKPALTQNRIQSGICGEMIRADALFFVKEARQIIQQNNLDLCLLGGGGIITPKDFSTFLEAGADCAMTAVGMMWDPYLAAKYKQEKYGKLN